MNYKINTILVNGSTPCSSKAAMKVFLIVPVVFLYLICVLSCGQRPPTETSFEKQLREEREARERLKKEYADSTVRLSFCGIKLAEPFKSTLNEARKAGTIKKLKYDAGGESATCQGEVYIAAWDKVLPIDVKVTSYQDTITSFLLMYNSHDGYKAIWRLFSDKYNTEASSIEDKADPWYDNSARSGSHSLIWSFKNQTLRLTEFYREEREWYVKNPDMKYAENRYDIKYTKYFQAITIIYSDLKQCAKVKAKEAQEARKNAVIETDAKAQKERQDREKKIRESTQDF